MQKHGTIHKTVQEATENKHIDGENIQSLNFNCVGLIIVTKLEIRSSQNKSKIVYKIDTGSRSDFIQYNMFKIIFPRIAMQQL